MLRTLTMEISASASAIVPCHPVVAWEFVAGLDPTVYYPAYGPLPAVVGVRDQTGDWLSAGQERTLLLSDRGHVVERLTDTRSPNAFVYELNNFQRLFGRLVSGGRADWRFDRVGHATRIVWEYSFRPLGGRGWVVAAIVRLAWAPYMRRVIRRIAADISDENTEENTEG